MVAVFWRLSKYLERIDVVREGLSHVRSVQISAQCPLLFFGLSSFAYWATRTITQPQPRRDLHLWKLDGRFTSSLLGWNVYRGVGCFWGSWPLRLGCGVGWRGGPGGSVELELAAWTVDFGPWWEILFELDSRFMTFTTFTTFYHLLLTDAV